MARRFEARFIEGGLAQLCMGCLAASFYLCTVTTVSLGSEQRVAQATWTANQLAQAAHSKDDVRQVQTFLTAQGYDPGPADGLMGAKTSAAIAAFEESAGWRVTGKISNRLLARTKRILEKNAAEKSTAAVNQGFLQRVAAATRPFSLDDIQASCPSSPPPDDSGVEIQDLGDMLLAFETRKGGELPGSYTTKKLCLENKLRRVELFYKSGEVSPEDHEAGDIGNLRILLYRSEGSKVDPEIGFDLVVFHDGTGPQKYYFAPDGTWLKYRQ